MSIRKELDVVCKALREDKELYNSWQANIAMSFFDEFNSTDKEGTPIMEIANKGAKNFLDMLIKEE